MFESKYSRINLVERIEKSSNHITYLCKENSKITIYPVITGVEIAFFHYNANNFIPLNHEHNKNILEIYHCLKGRAEFTMEDGCNQYLGEGDVLMFMAENYSHRIELPLNHYIGLNITIDINIANPIITKLLPNIDINLDSLIKKLFIDDECLNLQIKDEINAIFNGLYNINEEARLTFFQIKLMELLLYLHFLNVDEVNSNEVFLRPQVEIIKGIHDKLVNNLEQRYTIEDLAKENYISISTFKKYFKGVYGKSIALYLKEQRINKAGLLLVETDMSINDIALAVGYLSQSKFGASFKEVMKITPIEYRKKFSNHNINLFNNNTNKL